MKRIIYFSLLITGVVGLGLLGVGVPPGSHRGRWRPDRSRDLAWNLGSYCRLSGPCNR